MNFLGILDPNIAIGTTSNRPTGRIEFTASKYYPDKILYLTQSIDNEDEVYNLNKQFYKKKWFKYLEEIKDPKNIIRVWYDEDYKHTFLVKADGDCFREIFTNTKIQSMHLFCSELGIYSNIPTDLKLYGNTCTCHYCGCKGTHISMIPMRPAEKSIRISKNSDRILFTEITTTNKYICYDCFYNSAIKCYDCQELYHGSILKRFLIKGKTREIPLCKSCEGSYTICYNCKDFIHITNVVVTKDQKQYCNECATDILNICSSCGITLDKDKVFKYFDKKYCEVCLHSKIVTSRTIQTHNFKFNNPLFSGKFSPEFYFGFEFEIEVNRNYDKEIVARALVNKINATNGYTQLVYVKHDGSIASGFELVTNPMSIHFIKANMNIFEAIFSYKGIYGNSYDTTTCGFHIHISKSAFTHLHIYKLLRFMYCNDHKSTILKISERQVSKEWINKYCYWIKDHLQVIGDYYDEASVEKILKRQAKTKSNAFLDRHSLINLENAKTVEFRMFRGTLEKNRFLKNIEFVLSIVEFTRDTSLKNINLSTYLEFINKSNRYKNLVMFINNNFTFKE